jgi:hypothetical protein
VSYCASEGVLQFTNGVDDFQYVLQAALL